MNIKNYGWNKYFESAWNEKTSEGMFPGRIIADYGQILSNVEGRFFDTAMKLR